MDSKRFSLLAEGHRGGVQGYIAFLRGKPVTYQAAPATSIQNGSPEFEPRRWNEG